MTHFLCGLIFSVEKYYDYDGNATTHLHLAINVEKFLTMTTANLPQKTTTLGLKQYLKNLFKSIHLIFTKN